MINYEQLKLKASILHITIREIVTEVGITIDGLRKGLNNGSLSVKYVIPICKILCISPNDFFGVSSSAPGDINYGNMQKNGKKQIMHTGGSEELKETVELLRAQVATKDEQIRAQNEQIVQLIAKIK